MYDPLVDLYDSEPLRATKELPAEEVNALLASAHEAARQSTYPVSEALVASVFKRELPNGESAALREALRYISTVENYATKTPTKHTDLLPKGHPLNSDENFSREDLATYFSQTVSDLEEQKLLYEVIYSVPNSTERQFLINKIQSHQYALIAAVEASDKKAPAEEKDWDAFAALMVPEELGEDFAYVRIDEDGNEIFVRPEITNNRSRYSGSVIPPEDLEKNIDITRYDD